MEYNFDWLFNSPIAHRGLHDKFIPENSLGAFLLAVKSNFVIELDIHLLADGQIVVFHDEDLKRMCNKNIKISQLTSKNINQIYLNNSIEKIPLLSDVFQVVSGSVPILIEIKDQRDLFRNIKIQNTLLEQLNNYNGKVAIQSFNPFLLRIFKKKKPHIPRGQLSYNYADSSSSFIIKYLLRNYYLNFISSPHFLSHSIDDILNKRLVNLKKKGLKILYWTINNENKNRIDSLCDNYIFEHLSE